jgi:molybdenum cofactor cytidylyltransferase
MMSSKTISAIILAAGYSSRMGHFKPLLRFGSQTAIERAVHLFEAAGIRDIRVVVGHRADELIPVLKTLGTHWTLNSRFQEGMLSSVQAGVKDLSESSSAFFLLPVDIPLIRVRTVEDVLRTFNTARAEVVYPSFRGRRGHPPLISRCLYDGILAWNKEGGLQAFLNHIGPRSVEIEAADEYVLLNMNTPEQYRDLLKGFAFYDTPSPQECMAILTEKCAVSRGVLAHSCKVAEIAKRMVRELGARGCILNERLVIAAAFLHDLAKGRPDHGKVAAEWLRKLGYDRVAEVVYSHMDIVVDNDQPITETDILRLADRIVDGDQVVNLEWKFQKKMDRYRGNEGASAAIRERFFQAKELRHKVESGLGQEIEPSLAQVREPSQTLSEENLLAPTW